MNAPDGDVWTDTRKKGLRDKVRAIMARLAGLFILAALFPVLACAQTPSDADLQKRANAVLALMGFSLTPDVTTGSRSPSATSRPAIPTSARPPSAAAAT